MLKIIPFILMISILLITDVKALGTLQKKSHLEVKPGQVAEFTTLFWSQETIEIQLKEKNTPEDWIIIVEPKNFILNDQITSSEVIKIQDKYVKALPVKVLVIPSENAKPGDYEIVINMIAGKNDKEINFFQEKNFNFIITIPGENIEQKQTTSEPISKYISKTGNFTSPIEEMSEMPTNYVRIIFWLTVILLTLLICWALYKKL